MDVNSVAGTGTLSPRAAFTVPEEDFSTTIISGKSSSPDLVNVCRECGHKNHLYQNKDAFTAAVKAHPDKRSETTREESVVAIPGASAWKDEWAGMFF